LVPYMLQVGVRIPEHVNLGEVLMKALRSEEYLNNHNFEKFKRGLLLAY
jgi:hypothetical protein